ncbi:hypothetical protein F9B85_13845 [Heliorestis acidaminivorans]|uniref:Uncharacterized protein n=1 Tax=Heliorestis acidaminivorans TaxID=553427 RepID=A0A6I0ER53_9FIRM|nr:hypothetical protein [Heliorestis acidaminivorans]KAB2950843.1 hypothetical protein F9B85_13845 [Heliorestis acidaminivorans]
MRTYRFEKGEKWQFSNEIDQEWLKDIQESVEKIIERDKLDKIKIVLDDNKKIIIRHVFDGYMISIDETLSVSQSATNV